MWAKQGYMLQFLKKLKLYTKLFPQTVDSIHIKIYLQLYAYHHHLQKYFDNWNIKLNYCFICKINVRDYFI